MQAPGIGVPWPSEELARRATLDDAPGVHDHDAVGDFRHHAQIMGDQDDGRAEVTTQPLDQLEDLGLHRHIERRGRLVGDKQRGIAGERHGDKGALTHAAGELMGITVDGHRRMGNAHGIQQFDGAPAGLSDAMLKQIYGGEDWLQ